MFEPSSKYVYVVFLFLVIAVDFMYSQSTQETVPKFIIYAMGFVVALNIRDDIDSYIVLFSISLTSVLIAFWYLWQINDLLITNRVELPVDPNYLSCFICYGMLSMLLIASKSETRSSVTKFVFYVIIAMLVYVVLVLASRGVILALLVTIAFVWLRRYRTISIKNAGVIIALLIIVTQLPGSLSLIDRFSESNASNLNARLPLAIAAYKHLTDTSVIGLLFGEGTGSGAMGLKGVIYDTATSAHNDFIEIAMDYGLVGVSLFIFLYVVIIKNTLKENTLNSDIKLAFTVFTLLCSLTITPHKLYIFSWVIIGYLIVTKNSDDIVE
jgi:hypothetical protein